jgi:hypothetical protein
MSNTHTFQKNACLEECSGTDVCLLTMMQWKEIFENASYFLNQHIHIKWNT